EGRAGEGPAPRQAAEAVPEPGQAPARAGRPGDLLL
ncbi:MAG: hypothetical protein AVDCRST_MAG75-3018, partial [uncultured Propionibacteriaceae bacterium]